MAKVRLDALLVEKGYFDSREKAKASIMAGLVFVNNQKLDKPGTKIDSDNTTVYVKGHSIPYVSRGGLKLEKAVKQFKISLQGKVCLDIGASTGGFTDCMLQNGANKVYAIDVGYGQLDWKLRQNSKVICMERTNIRNVKPEDIGELADFASVDVSFISLKLVLPVLIDLLKADGQVVALVKPQFEAGREKVGKKGVVRDAKIHKEVVFHIVDFAKNIGLQVIDFSYSPIKGPEGNIEYLLYLGKVNSDDKELSKEYFENIINESHFVL